MSGGGAVQQRTSYDYDDDSSGGYDTRSSEEYDYDQSYQHTQHPTGHQRSNGVVVVGSGEAGRPSAGGYAVAQSHDYLGYPKDQAPFDSRGLWDDEEKAEDLW